MTYSEACTALRLTPDDMSLLTVLVRHRHRPWSELSSRLGLGHMSRQHVVRRIFDLVQHLETAEGAIRAKHADWSGPAWARYCLVELLGSSEGAVAAALWRRVRNRDAAIDACGEAARSVHENTFIRRAREIVSRFGVCSMADDDEDTCSYKPCPYCELVCLVNEEDARQ